LTGADARRLKVRNKYREILGRNHYSQARRNYCYKKYSDGKYYSDCSSSVSYAYKEAGEGFGIMRTTDMYASAKFIDVPAIIEKGQVKNPEVLRVGDMLLFAGTDPARKKWGYVGHVEMVGEINYRPASSDKSGPQVSGGTANVLALSPAEAGRSPVVTLYGHGSGRPKKRDMAAYCKSRYNAKTAKTPLGNTGLIRVRRFIRDGGRVQIGGSTVYVRTGPGIDRRILGVARRGEIYPLLGEQDGWHRIDWRGEEGWVSGRYSRLME